MSDEVAELKKENAKLRLEANLRKSLANQLERQKQVANEAKIELEEKHRNLISSLNYAARIQQTILPTDDAVQNVFPGSYIFWRPQFIVGGDAYFMRRPSSGAGAVFGVYDCTGHGVSGAFMTLLAERALDAGVEAIGSEGNSQNRAGRILAYVDEFIRAEVNASDGTTSNDGMDAFLLDYRPGGNSFYASANFNGFAQGCFACACQLTNWTNWRYCSYLHHRRQWVHCKYAGSHWPFWFVYRARHFNCKHNCGMYYSFK